MTTDDPTLDDDDQEPSALRARLAEEARARAEAQAELAALRTKDLFRDAGIDPSKPLHAAAMRGYEGELTGDAVRSYVAELGITAEAPAPPPQNPASADEQAALERMAAAGAGDGVPPPEPDRREQLRKQLAEASMRGDIQEMNRLSEEFSRAGGFKVKSDYQ